MLGDGDDDGDCDGLTDDDGLTLALGDGETEADGLTDEEALEPSGTSTGAKIA